MSEVPQSAVDCGVTPLVIDLTRLPEHTHTQKFWDGFLPNWAVATVHDDNTVVLLPAVHYLFPNGRPGPTRPAAVRRRGQALRRWVAGSSLGDAVVGDMTLGGSS